MRQKWLRSLIQCTFSHSSFCCTDDRARLAICASTVRIFFCRSVVCRFLEKALSRPHYRPSRHHFPAAALLCSFVLLLQVTSCFSCSKSSNSRVGRIGRNTMESEKERQSGWWWQQQKLMQKTTSFGTHSRRRPRAAWKSVSRGEKELAKGKTKKSGFKNW